MKIRVVQNLIESPKFIQLGHINAICGRNNSGKSTLLRALEGGRFYFVDFLNRFSHENFVDMARSSMHSPYGGNLDQAASAVGLALASQAIRGDIISSDANERLEEAVMIAYAPQRNAVQFQFGQLLSQLQSILPPIPDNRKIVPAKRRLRDGVSVSSTDQPQLSGQGVVEHLFRLQNHRTDRAGMKRLERLEGAFEQVTSGYKFEIDLHENSLLLFFRLGEGELISANECGIGLQDVLIMLYASLIDDAQWVLVEEPENHLHPAMQRELLRFFSTVEEKTFFMATHSSVMLDQTYVDSILQCSYESGSISVTDATPKSALLADLGYSVTDNLTADVVLMVEGPKDKEAIEEIIRKLPSRPDRAVRIWLLGGDIMDQQDFETIHQSFKVRVLIDKEANKGSRRIRANVKAECDRLEIPCTVLDRYAMENYYSLSAYQRVFPQAHAVTAINPNTKVEDQIGFNPKNCTRALMRETSLDHLEGTDLLDFVRAAYN